MRLTRRTLLICLGILLAMAFIVWISPEERTLGARIKVVYVHVSFVWTGLLGFTLTGFLSSFVMFRWGNDVLEKYLPIINVTSLAFFLIGFGLSLIAARVNWGHVAWLEPRAVGAMRIIAMALIVLVLTYFTKNIRFKATLYITQLVFIVYTQSTIKNAIHPENPIFTSDSMAFAITVLSLTGLVFALAALAVYVQGNRKQLEVSN